MLVTGGSQGLGLALAKLLAQRGAHVVICSRSEAKLKTALADVEVRISRLRQKCRSFEEQQLDYVVGDVSTFDGAAKAVAQCPFVASAVFCCAGGAKPGFFLDQNEADFQQGMKLDYWTALATAHVRTLILTQAAAASMKQHGVHGKIVFVSSVLGFMGMVGYAQYSPMKYAIRGTCANDLMSQGWPSACEWSSKCMAYRCTATFLPRSCRRALRRKTRRSPLLRKRLRAPTKARPPSNVPRIYCEASNRTTLM